MFGTEEILSKSSLDPPSFQFRHQRSFIRKPTQFLCSYTKLWIQNSKKSSSESNQKHNELWQEPSSQMKQEMWHNMKIRFNSCCYYSYYYYFLHFFLKTGKTEHFIFSLLSYIDWIWIQITLIPSVKCIQTQMPQHPPAFHLI